MKEMIKPVYRISGARVRSIEIYPNKCVITVSVTFGSIFSSNATDGQKTIFYCDVVGVQFKKPGMTLGYIQLETASSSQNNEQSDLFNENTFTFEDSQLSAFEAEKIRDYIVGQVELIKTMSCFGITPAQEISKFKKLFEEGIISKKEYSDNRAIFLNLMGCMAEYEESVLQEKRERKEQKEMESLQAQEQFNQHLKTIMNSSANPDDNTSVSFDIPGLMNFIQGLNNTKEILEYVQAFNVQNPGFFNSEIIEQLTKRAYIEKMYGNNKQESIKLIAQYLGIMY